MDKCGLDVNKVNANRLVIPSNLAVQAILELIEKFKKDSNNDFVSFFGEKPQEKRIWRFEVSVEASQFIKKEFDKSYITPSMLLEWARENIDQNIKTLDDIAKILQSSPKLPNNDDPIVKNLPAYQEPEIQKEGTTGLPESQVDMGTVFQPLVNIGTEFISVNNVDVNELTRLINVARRVTGAKESRAIVIAALYLLPSTYVPKRTIEEVVFELNKLLNNKFKSTTLRVAISDVLNNSAITDYQRSRDGYKLLDDVREEIMSELQFEKIAEKEALSEETKKELLIDAFVKFFTTYADDKGTKIYIEKIKDLLTITPKKYVLVDWIHLNSIFPEIAKAVINDPEVAIEAANDALKIVLRDEFFRDDAEFTVRFYNLPELLTVKQVTPSFINKLVQVRGVVVAAQKSVVPFMTKTVFLCQDCGNEIVRLQQPYVRGLKKISKCDQCGSKNIVIDYDKSEMIDYLEITIQDPLQGSDNNPAELKVILLGDLVYTDDKKKLAVQPGDELIVTGIYRVYEDLNPKQPKLKVVLIAHHLEKLRKDYSEIELTSNDIDMIENEVKRKDFEKRLIKSFAPHLVGMDREKLAALLALLSLDDEYVNGRIKRKRIHVLYVGDPGSGKSQILQFAASIAPRGLYTTGENASGVGLTAAVTRMEDEYVLSAGALVLADKGLCAIDEFDKLSKQDTKNLHTALESGFVRIDKAVFHATLNARAVVLAAANPKWGRYSRMKELTEQIDIPAPILSRFDLIFVVLDDIDKQRDELIADAILIDEVSPEDPPYSVEFLRKYIAYAHQKVKKVKLTEEVARIFKKYYVKTRQNVKKLKEQEDVDVLPIGPRQLQALVRLAQARARMFLRDYVTVEDAKAVIELFEYSLRYAAMTEEGIMDVSILEVGKSMRKLKTEEVVIDIIKELQDTTDYGAPLDDIVKEAVRKGIDKRKVLEAIEGLMKSGRIYSLRDGYYKIL